MHTLFASYEPEAHGIPLPDAVVRPGSAQDAEQTGRLAAYREGEPTERWVGIHHRKVSNEDNCLVVAELDGRVVGFGWASYLRPVESGGHGAPDGWYLSGVVVDESVRRRGLGLRLTPSLEFIADALPDTAAHMEDLLRAAKESDAAVAAAATGATYAGDADPYKKPAEPDEDAGSEEPADGSSYVPRG